MHQGNLVASLLAVTALGWQLPAHASEPRSPAGVIAAEHAWVRALEAHDAGSLRRRLAPEFQDTSWEGRLRSYTDVLDAAALNQAMKNSLSDLQVKIIGNVAIVHGLNTVNGPGTSSARIRFTDVFVYRRGAWRAISAQETLQQ